jgi:hypothetical protein
LGSYTLSSTLQPNFFYSNVSVNVVYTAPPSGTYYVVMLLTEFTGESGSGYTIRDSVEFDNLLVVGSGLFVPSISVPPTDQSVLAGTSISLSVVAAGSGSLNYQWFKNGTAISGANAATLSFASVKTSDAGSYTVSVSNSAGSVTSPAVTLTVAGTSRITNLSILTALTSATDRFTLGYVVGNASASNPLSLIIRAAGPALGALGYPGTMTDPKLETYAGSTKIGENDNWGGTGTLKTAFTSVGAFGYASDTSKDAASLVGITTGQNSVIISAANAGTGAVIGEVYDATPAASITASSPRLINVSVLKPIGASLTVGFSISGTGSKTVLIRALGPTLATLFGFPASSIIVDPKLTLYSGQTIIGSNDDWGGTAALTAAFTAAGTFTFDARSRDAALIATLLPGSYTVVVAPFSGATGNGLVEVYELP